jgi:hypothetical protein
LKINKTSIKGSRTKIRNKMTGIEVEILTIKRTNLYFSGRREKKRKIKKDLMETNQTTIVRKRMCQRF